MAHTPKIKLIKIKIVFIFYTIFVILIDKNYISIKICKMYTNKYKLINHNL